MQTLPEKANERLQVIMLQAKNELANVKEIRDQEGQVTIFPQRPKEGLLCDFFVKTGSCKFGQSCHFHHPLSYSVKISAVTGHPMRPGQPVCPFYDRTGKDALASELTTTFLSSDFPVSNTLKRDLSDKQLMRWEVDTNGKFCILECQCSYVGWSWHGISSRLHSGLC